MDDEIKDEVAGHLGTLQTEFKFYFPELGQDAVTLPRNPFRVAIEQVDDELQRKLMNPRSTDCKADALTAMPRLTNLVDHEQKKIENH